MSCIVVFPFVNWWQVKQVCEQKTKHCVPLYFSHSWEKIPLKLNFVQQKFENFLFLVLRIVRAKIKVEVQSQEEMKLMKKISTLELSRDILGLFVMLYSSFILFVGYLDIPWLKMNAAYICFLQILLQIKTMFQERSDPHESELEFSKSLQGLFFQSRTSQSRYPLSP